MYRFYIGHTPVLVVADPEMVKEITIKQSANFMDRSVSAGILSNADAVIHKTYLIASCTVLVKKFRIILESWKI